MAKSTAQGNLLGASLPWRLAGMLGLELGHLSSRLAMQENYLRLLCCRW